MVLLLKNDIVTICDSLDGTCGNKLRSAFGTSMADHFLKRGIKCTIDYTDDEERFREADNNPLTKQGRFLNLSTPLPSLGGRSFIEAFPQWYTSQAKANRNPPER